MLGWSEPSGRFYLPAECGERTRVVRAIAGLFEGEGFREIVLPTLMYVDDDSVSDMGTPAEKTYRLFDRQGNLLVLRPDMTPVVARFASRLGWSSSLPLRLYYQGSVFRSEDPGGGKRSEFLQVGGEIIGADCDAGMAVELIATAAKCLRAAGIHDFQIGFGHMTALQDVLLTLGCPDAAVQALKDCLSRRDLVGFERLLQATDLRPSFKDLIADLTIQHDVRSIFSRLSAAGCGASHIESIAGMLAVLDGLEAYGLAKNVYVDFGLSRPFDYYTGLVIEGYAPGAGMPVIGGGAYSFKLADGTLLPAAGFALDIDLIVDALACDRPDGAMTVPDSLSIALPAGRLLTELKDILESAGVACSPKAGSPRSLVFAGEGGIRTVIARPGDVPTYVEQGAADLGIVGEDVLAEGERNVAKVLDLKAGACRMVVAAPLEHQTLLEGSIAHPLRIATKYPAVATGYFRRKGIPVEIIRLNGSVEVAPSTGLADGIVDICSTGATLRDNGLLALDEVLSVSARLIANRASLRLKRRRISEIVSALDAEINSGRRSK